MRRHAGLALLAIQKVILRLRGGRDRILNPDGTQTERDVFPLDPTALDAQDLARLADVAVKIERLARGLPTEHAEVTERVVGADADLIAQRIIEDPSARALVADLFTRLAERHGRGTGEVGAGGLGDVRQPGEVEAGAPPGTGQ